MVKTRRTKKTFIREWRKYRGLTQEQLAERVQVTQEAISKLESGRTSYTQPMIEAIADALNVEVASLLMRDPSAPEPIWTIWDKIPHEQRDLAVQILTPLARKTGTDG